MPHTLRHRSPLATPAWLVIGMTLHIGTTALAGWLLAQTEGRATGLCLLVITTGAAVQALVSLRRRIRGVLAHSSDALRRLGRGDNSFLLDSQGLADFEELQLAIHDLREATEAVEPSVVRGRTGRVRADLQQRPAPTGNADWVFNHP